MNALEALYRCQRAWERSQPQLFMELYPDGLDDAHGVACDNTSRRVEAVVRVVEPAVSPAASPGGGLIAGAEPCRGTTKGLTASAPHRPEISPAAAPSARSGGSAPLHPTNTPRSLNPGQVSATGARR